jgi:hypothetical protein
MTGVWDRTIKKPPRRSASTEKLIERIESNNNNGRAFDPKALLNLLEENGEDDGVSFRSDSSSFAPDRSDSDENSIIGSEPRRAASAAAGQQRASSSVMSRQSRPSNITMITHINSSGYRLPISSGASVHTYAPPSSVVSRQSNATMMTHINNNFDRISSSGSSIHSNSSSLSGTTAWQKWWSTRGNISICFSAFALVLLFSLYNMSIHRTSLETYRDYTAESVHPSKTTQQFRGVGGETHVPFVMCDRETPFRYSLNHASDRSNRKEGSQKAFRHDWPKENKILLLRNDGKFGNIGNQMNSLLHAFDYARDHKQHLGMLFHSWAMDVIQTMFYETDDFEALGDELKNDLGILVVRNQTQLALYDEVVSKNAEQLYFYRSSNKNMDHWRETMAGESFLLFKKRIVFFRFRYPFSRAKSVSN